jgi:hypothetical protein
MRDLDLGAGILAAGVLLHLAAWIWLAVRGFRASVPWGILLTLVPSFASPCFALYHWKAARVPMAIYYASFGVIWLGGWVMGPVH